MDNRKKPSLRTAWVGASKILLISMIGLIFLALAGCQISTRKVFQEGKYRRSGSAIFFKEGHYFISEPEDKIIEEGSYTVDGDTIILQAEKMSGSTSDMWKCGNISVYIYKWAYDAKSEMLTLNEIHDPCVYRAGRLGVPYKYVEGEG